MIEVSAAIMAHPSRDLEVVALLDRLDRQVSISWDREGPASGNHDRVWRNARAAWLSYDAMATHHVLLQDDALVCEDLLAGLQRALAYVPENAIVSPYLGTGNNVPMRWKTVTDRAIGAGARWIRSDTVMWGVCLVVPTALIPEMIAWCDRKAGRPDDMRVGGWARNRGMEVWYPWPSLVDHHSVLPSLTKHRARTRVARRFHEGSALDLDWGGPVVTDMMLARHTAGRSGPSQRVAH